LAQRASAFRMRLSAIDIRPITEAEQKEFGLEFAGTPDDMDRLIADSDYVSLHLPLNQQTRHTMDARRLSLMKPSARLINVARGALIDQEALYQALAEGRIAGAGLDVFDPEPIDPDDPLLTLPNVIGLPHLAGNTFATSRRRAEFIAQNVDLVAEGQAPRSRIE
jgi:phosphoglycerate dehydrogenase-like enzyme